MDTSTTVFTLVGYEDVYGRERSIEEAKNLIRNIASATLINYLAGFSVHLYLNEFSDSQGKTQAGLINTIVNKAGTETAERWRQTLERQVAEGHARW